MSEDTNPVDMAVILEGRIKERVKELMEPMVERFVVNLIGKELNRQWNDNKEKMMMEIAVQIGKIIKESDERDRRPLWESKPEEFGLTSGMLNTHNMGKQLELDE